MTQPLYGGVTSHPESCDTQRSLGPIQTRWSFSNLLGFPVGIFFTRRIAGFWARLFNFLRGRFWDLFFFQTTFSFAWMKDNGERFCFIARWDCRSRHLDFVWDLKLRRVSPCCLKVWMNLNNAVAKSIKWRWLFLSFGFESIFLKKSTSRTNTLHSRTAPGVVNAAWGEQGFRARSFNYYFDYNIARLLLALAALHWAWVEFYV